MVALYAMAAWMALLTGQSTTCVPEVWYHGEGYVDVWRVRGSGCTYRPKSEETPHREGGGLPRNESE